MQGRDWALMHYISEEHQIAAIIGREIAMSALREWAAATSEEAHKAAAVSSLGKWKTTTQVRLSVHTSHSYCAHLTLRSRFSQKTVQTSDRLAIKAK